MKSEKQMGNSKLANVVSQSEKFPRKKLLERGDEVVVFEIHQNRVDDLDKFVK